MGTSGWIPSDKRATSTFLVATNNSLIILDAGTGLYKLERYVDVINKYEEVNIILSHYHLDHIIGLIYMPRWFKDKKVTIWGPGEKYYGSSCHEILSGITKSPYFSVPITEMAKEVYLRDYDESGFMIGNLSIGINQQVHSNPSFGISIDDYLHYATDTTVLDISFQKKSKLLLHECWSLTKKDAKGHSSLEEIVEKSKIFNKSNIGLIHLNARCSENDLKMYDQEFTFIVEEDKKITL